MKVLLIGLKYFSHKLAKDLSEKYPEHSFEAFDTYYSKKDLIKFLWKVRSCDLVYSIKGTTAQSKAFDWVLKKNKKLIIQWAGTDVLMANESLKNDSGSRKYASYAKNYCEAPWLIEELKEVGIEAEQLIFTGMNSSKSPKELPSKFRAFTYLGKGREEFYGKSFVLSLAEHFPEIEFLIVGSDVGQDRANIKSLGWVDGLESVINDSVIHIRWTDHDSLANTVIETLQKGRYVIWKNEFETTINCDSKESVIKAIKELKNRFDDGSLSLNQEGIDFIKNDFDKDKVLANVFNEMKSHVEAE